MFYESYGKNIFSFPENFFLICTVNCVGVMGKGLALEFRNRFAEFFADYKIACINNKISIGNCWIWPKINLFENSVICFPTKLHWREPSEYKFIEKGLNSLGKLVDENKINNLIIPKLGCGCGGLDYVIVKNLIFERLKNINSNFYLI